MEWSKLYSDYYEDGAVVDAGEDGEVLFLRAIAWSSGKDLVGFIPTWQLERFGLKNVRRRAAKLVAEHLWTVVDGGWQITNYEKLQAETTSAEKRRKADRARKQARRSAEMSAEKSARMSADIPHAPSRLSPVVVNGRDEKRETRDESPWTSEIPKPRTTVTREVDLALESK